MRVANVEHTSRPWRIHRIAPDFLVEDVWALPVHGRAEDFADLVSLMTDREDATPADDLDFLDSAAARALWRARDVCGRILRLGTVTQAARPEDRRSIPGESGTTLEERLDVDLRGTTAGLCFASVPMRPLYLTDSEFAAEISNATMHGVMHLSWVDRGRGQHQGQMAVLVKPRGCGGALYMRLIKPFRLTIVYPALLRYLEKSWNRRGRETAPSQSRPQRSRTQRRSRAWSG